MAATFPILPDGDQALARAFASFSEAAGSLERTYGQLQSQVEHLRQELEVTNRDLATSLDENRRIRERLRRTVEGLPCGVLVIEANAFVLNPEAQRLLGASTEQVQVLPSVVGAALEKARVSGEECELRLPTRDGGTTGEVWMAVRHAWLDQEHKNSVFILRDVSESKKLEREREEMRRQQALVEMSALLAHEIRNPLGSLELFAGLLAEADLDGDCRQWVEHVQAGLRTLAATTNNVLHLHNTPAPELAEFDAGELLDWSFAFLRPLAKQAQVSLQVLNCLRGVQVRGDRHRLEQVILNLALNAVRFMAGGGWLAIGGCKIEGDAAEITVRDTGPGIAEEHLSRIFEPGFSTRPGSSGLGLAVCRKILEQHKGTISVGSHDGKGATFRLSLPLAEVSR